MLTVKNIIKAYGRVKVLQGISFSCEGKEAVCVAGMNATGKTTLLSILAGMSRADAGTFHADGKISYVPQFSTLISELTVREQLKLWYAANDLPGAGIFSENAVETRLGLAPYAKYRIDKLSGGLQKRVLSACAMAGMPDILLMDEPFTALDLQSRADIIEEMRLFKAQGKVVVFTSHDPSAIAQLADRVLLLEDGKIQKEQILRDSITERTIQTVNFIASVQ